MQIKQIVLLSGVTLLAYYNLYAFIIWFAHILSIYLVLKIKVPTQEPEAEPKPVLSDSKYSEGVLKRMQNLMQYK